MTLKSVLFAAVIVATAAATQANADYSAFGFSGAENQQLTLNFSGGGSVTLDTGGNQGWWSDTSFNQNGNTNYITGSLFDGATKFNDFFVFDLSQLTGTVTSATLTLDTATI